MLTNPLLAAMAMNTTITGLLLSGAALFLYFYHVRTRSIENVHRVQVTSFAAYRYVDWYLKGSSLLVTVAAIHSQSPVLLPFHDRMPLRLIGLGIAGLALVLFVWAMRCLGSQYSDAHMARLPDRIIKSGPYRWIRHPIYTANVILLIGLTLVSGSYWLVINLVVLVTFYVFIVRKEEAAIASVSEEYGEYIKQTGRWLPRPSRLLSLR